MRPLIIFGKERMPAFKDKPSSYEQGMPIALPQFRSIVVRAGTPADHVHKLSAVLAQVAAAPEYKKFLHDQFAVENSFLDASKATEFVNEQLEDMKKAVATH
jgi:tripartite-type tricarboxylate transporter receptor subunit TctC